MTLQENFFSNGWTTVRIKISWNSPPKAATVSVSSALAMIGDDATAPARVAAPLLRMARRDSVMLSILPLKSLVRPHQLEEVVVRHQSLALLDLMDHFD